MPPSQLEFLLNKWSPFSTQIHRIEVSSAQISTFELSFLFHLFYSCGSSAYSNSVFLQIIFCSGPIKCKMSLLLPSTTILSFTSWFDLKK